MRMLLICHLVCTNLSWCSVSKDDVQCSHSSGLAELPISVVFSFPLSHQWNHWTVSVLGWSCQDTTGNFLLVWDWINNNFFSWNGGVSTRSGICGCWNDKVSKLSLTLRPKFDLLACLLSKLVSLPQKMWLCVAYSWQIHIVCSSALHLLKPLNHLNLSQVVRPVSVVFRSISASVLSGNTDTLFLFGLLKPVQSV